MKAYINVLFISLVSFSLFGQNIPIDFEENGHGADWSWRTFENDTDPPLDIIANPDPSGINTSATVAQFTALQSGQPFAGCESLHGSDIGSFTIDAESSTISIMVWKSVISDVGIKLVRADNWSLGEIKIANTLVDQWEKLEFDFSGHIGNTYDQIVIFPDFKNRNADNVIYFDNVYGGVEGTSSISSLSNVDFKLYPNPTTNTITIQTESHVDKSSIYSVTGYLVDTFESGSNNPTIDVSDLAAGVYLMKIKSAGQVQTRKFVKE